MIKALRSILIAFFCSIFVLSSATLLAHAQTAQSNCVITEIGSAGGKPQLPTHCLCSAGSGSTDTSEPAHNYKRVSYSGQTVNARTLEMLQVANRLAKGFGVPTPLDVVQGSYNAGGVAASAGTHDGGGAVDISVNNMNATQYNNAVKALRMAGFAAWYRSPSEGDWPAHIHGIAIGDRESSAGAKDQVTSYFAGGDGLAGSGKDTAPASVGRPIPAWAEKYGGKATAPAGGGANCPDEGGTVGGPAIQAAIELARKQIGKPYSWGAPTRDWASNNPNKGQVPNSFDCSGLTGWAYYWATGGKINLNGQTSSDWGSPGKNLQKFTDKSKLQPGDLIYFGDPSPYHTAIYIGGGNMLHAPRTGTNVRIEPLSNMSYDFIGFLRPMVQ